MKEQQYCKICNKEISGRGSTGLCHSCCMKGKNNPGYLHGSTLIKRYCIDCGKELSKNSYQKNSKRCQSCTAKERNKIPENNSNWKGGLVEVKCDFCTKIKKVKQKELKLKHHFCNIKCYSKWLEENVCGKNNPFYNKKHSEEIKKHLSIIHGGTGIPYETTGYGSNWTEDLKESIRKRDDFTCQECGVPQEDCKRKLAVHHIDYDKQNMNPINLIALCDSCHGKTMVNRNHWTKYFKARLK